MNWWEFFPKRAKEEVENVKDVKAQEAWLIHIGPPSIDSGRLCIEFDIKHLEQTYPLKIEYPEMFPDVPPRILHREGLVISGHQYGGSGELCLPNRPENWNSEVSGAVMIADAYELISTENPEVDEKGRVISGHSQSLGQSLQSEICRFILPDPDKSVFSIIPDDLPCVVDLCTDDCAETYVLHPLELHLGDALIWETSQALPIRARKFKGLLLNDLDGKINLKDPTEDIIAAVCDMGFGEAWSELATDNNRIGLVVRQGSDWNAIILYKNEDELKSLNFKTVIVPAAKPRLPDSLEDIGLKRVALIGCGSIGSKVATTLARSGVKTFLLADDDIFLPGNLVRNELRAEAIGFHKVDALKQHMDGIFKDCEIETRAIGVGKQNSARRTSDFLQLLASYDVIIDATANPRVYNLIGAVCQRYEIPLVKCSVFEGGIGGTVLRVRPHLDPTPMLAIRKLRAWCDAQDEPWEGRLIETEPYGVQINDEETLIAGDAEVSVLAGHASRFVLDILGNQDESQFPQSAYLIGLTENWIFKAPFQTFPVDLGPGDFGSGGDWGMPNNTKTETELEAFLDMVEGDDQEK